MTKLALVGTAFDFPESAIFISAMLGTPSGPQSGMGYDLLMRAHLYLIAPDAHKRRPSLNMTYWMAEYGVSQFLVDFNGKGVWS